MFIDLIISCCIFLALWKFNTELYKYLFYHLKNEYFCALLGWIFRVIVLIVITNWMTSIHPVFMMYMWGWHIVEGLLMLLILIIGSRNENKVK